MLQSENMSVGQAIVQSTTTSILVVFFQSMLHTLIPYLFIIVAIVILDLVQGVRAAKKRKEEVRVSRAIRRTVSKVFEYCCWIIFAGSLYVTTKSHWLFYIILVIPFITEFYSIVTNYLFASGKKITGLNLWKIFGNKLGVDLEDVKIEDIEENK